MANMALGNRPPSKFIRRLNQVSAGVAAKIGFRAQQAEEIPALLIVVTLPSLEPKLAEAAVNGGAGALQVRMNLQDEPGDAQVLERLLKAAGDCPCGVVLAGTSGASLDRIESWRLAGIDYVVLGSDSDPAYLGISGLGKVIALDYTVDRDLVRTVNDLPFDAVQASIAGPDDVGKPLAIREVMGYRYVSLTVRKPVVVQADYRIQPRDVGALREARVEGLAIDVTEMGSDAESIRKATAEFAQAVKALGRARGRTAAPIYPTVPLFQPGRETTGVPEEEPEPGEE